MSHLLAGKKTFNPNFKFTNDLLNIDEFSKKKNDVSVCETHNISFFNNEKCNVCKKGCQIHCDYGSYPFLPTEANFCILKENNSFCIALFLRKGRWPEESSLFPCKEYSSDCDNVSENPKHCHKIGQPPMIFSVERNNLDDLKSFCIDHKDHISNTFKTFLEQNFPIKF
jgi:hypothetical protein